MGSSWPTSYKSTAASSAYSGLKPGQRFVDQVRSGNWTVFQGADGSWHYALTHNNRPAPPIRELLTPEEAAARRAAQYANIRQDLAQARDFSRGYQKGHNLGAPAIVGINPYALAGTIGRAALRELIDSLVPWPVQVWNELLPSMLSREDRSGEDGFGNGQTVTWNLPAGWALYTDCGHPYVPTGWSTLSRHQALTGAKSCGYSSQQLGNEPAGLGAPFPVTQLFSPTFPFLKIFAKGPGINPGQYRAFHHLCFEFSGGAAQTQVSVPTFTLAWPRIQKAFPNVQPRAPLELWPLANPPGVPVSRGRSLPLGWSNGAKRAQADLPNGSSGGNHVPGTPTVRPRPDYGTSVGVSVGPPGSPPVTTTYPSGPRGPGGPGTKEKKGAAQTAMARAAQLAFAATEGIDAIKAIFEALPDHIQASVGSKPTPQEMAWAIYQNLDSLDLTEAAYNLIYNHFEDKVVGRANAARDKGMRALTGRTNSTWFM